MKTAKLNITASILLISILLQSHDIYAERQTLVLAADYWCPYNCMPKDKNPGYLIELVRRALFIYEIDVEYRLMPWNEALIQMEDGKIDGLIGISNIRGGELLTTRLPLEHSIVATFTKNDTEWVYDGPSSLRGKRIGLIMDYEMGESISNYFSINYAKSTGSFLVEDGELAVSQSIKNLIEDKSDVYIEDRRVVRDYLVKNGLEDKVRDAGRVDNIDLPVHIVFSKKIPDIDIYIKNLEEGIASLKATGEYEDLRAKYHMDHQ